MNKRVAIIAGMAFATPLVGIGQVRAKDSVGDVSASWATMDANADGSLSAEEVSATPWQEKFVAIDSNGDGQATKREFRSYMASLQRSQKGHSSSQDKM